MDTDMGYNKHFLMQHDLLRDLAIRECNQEPFEQRKRLVVDLSGNNRPEWWEGQNQRGIVSRMLSFLPKRWIPKVQKQVVARTLCISTGLFLKDTLYVHITCSQRLVYYAFMIFHS